MAELLLEVQFCRFRPFAPILVPWSPTYMNDVDFPSIEREFLATQLDILGTRRSSIGSRKSVE